METKLIVGIYSMRPLDGGTMSQTTHASPIARSRARLFDLKVCLFSFYFSLTFLFLSLGLVWIREKKH